MWVINCLVLLIVGPRIHNASSRRSLQGHVSFPHHSRDYLHRYGRHVDDDEGLTDQVPEQHALNGQHVHRVEDLTRSIFLIPGFWDYLILGPRVTRLYWYLMKSGNKQTLKYECQIFIYLLLSRYLIKNILSKPLTFSELKFDWWNKPGLFVNLLKSQ